VAGRIAAIDQGTTSTRILLAEGATARIVHAVEHRQHYRRPGWVEHDPEELVANIVAGLAAAARDAPIDAIGIDNQGESCLAWDAATKRAVSPVIVWQDNRTTPTIERLKAAGAETLTLERAGLPLDAYFSAAKLAWIVEHVDEAKALRARGRLRLGTTDAFFLDRLAGRFVTDVTTASRTSLMNLETGAWDAELCELFGVPMESLPEIVPTVGDFGAVALAGREVPVTASLVDQQAGLYGHGCRAPGDAKITFGTGAFALAVTGTEICRAPQIGLLPTVAWRLPDRAASYALDGGVYTAGAAVSWARALGLFRDFTEIGDFDGSSAIERGIVFVPALSGLACPHWDRDAAGLWLGLTLDTGPRDMVRAVLEGVALRAAEVMAAMGRHVDLAPSISIDGGLSRNGYFCRFLARVLGREIVARGSGELTALGTAMLAGADSGIIFADDAPDRRHAPAGDAAALRARFTEAIALSRSWGRAELAGR
jgi:glycerol kinase